MAFGISSIDLDTPGILFTPVTKSISPYIDLAANTLPALGNKVPEKWEGLTIGPRLSDGSHLILAGTDNDYSVTQNGSNEQFDVYFRTSDSNPYATSIQCPLNQTANCFRTDNNNNPATLSADYKLLPGVLHAYKASVDDLAGYIAPTVVPEPPTYALLLTGFGLLGILNRIELMRKLLRSFQIKSLLKPIALFSHPIAFVASHV